MICFGVRFSGLCFETGFLYIGWFLHFIVQKGVRWLGIGLWDIDIQGVIYDLIEYMHRVLSFFLFKLCRLSLWYVRLV
jgi:hypothetical protein